MTDDALPVENPNVRHGYFFSKQVLQGDQVSEEGQNMLYIEALANFASFKLKVRPLLFVQACYLY